jgi:hypothetical protein
MVPELMELWLQEHAAHQAGCAPDGVDPAAIRSAAAAAFPAMNSFSRCLLGRFAGLCHNTT